MDDLLVDCVFVVGFSDEVLPAESFELTLVGELVYFVVDDLLVD